MALPLFNKYGRLYERGKAIDTDLKRNIIQDIIEQGGDLATGYFPGSFMAVAQKYKVKVDTVRKIWKCFWAHGRHQC